MRYTCNTVVSCSDTNLHCTYSLFYFIMYVQASVDGFGTDDPHSQQTVHVPQDHQSELVCINVLPSVMILPLSTPHRKHQQTSRPVLEQKQLQLALGNNLRSKISQRYVYMYMMYYLIYVYLQNQCVPQ